MKCSKWFTISEIFFCTFFDSLEHCGSENRRGRWGNNGTILCFALRVHYESRRKAPNTRSTSSRVLFRLGCHNTKVGRTVVLPGSSVIGKSLKTKNCGLVFNPYFCPLGNRKNVSVAQIKCKEIWNTNHSLKRITIRWNHPPASKTAFVSKAGAKKQLAPFCE